MKNGLILFKKFIMEHKKRLIMSFLLLIMILILALPPLYKNFSEEKEKAAFAIAQSAQSSINRYKIKALDLNESDLSKNEFLEIQRAMKRFTMANDEIDDTYILAKNQNDIVMGVDAENFIMPGTVLGKAEDFGLQSSSNDSFSLRENPFGKDYVMVVAPITDDTTSEEIAYYVNLYSAKAWKRFAISETARLAAIILVIYFLLNAFYFVGNLNYNLYHEKQQLLKANEELNKAKIQEKKNTSQIIKSQKELSKVFEMVPTMLVWISDKGIVKNVNKAFGGKLGFHKDMVMGKCLFDLEIFEREKACQIKASFDRRKYISNEDTQIKSMDGKKYFVYMSFDSVGEAKEDFIFSFIDITKRKQAQDEIKSLMEKYKTIIGVSNTGGWEYNISNNEFFLTEEYFSLLGLTPIAEKRFDLKKDWYDLIHPDDRKKAYKNFMNYLRENKTTMYENYFRMKHANGQYLWILSRGRRLYDKKGSQNILGTHIDITDLKKKEEQIEYLNSHDQLTGLDNRRSYEKRLKDFLKKTQMPLAVVMADVNGLKLTNDAFGHLYGDNLLKKVASIIKKELRKEDFVARIGGDEFIILMPKRNSLNAQELVKRINSVLDKNQSKNMVLSVSFGWGTKKDDDEDYINVYKRAEYRMYRNKLSERKSKRGESIKLIFRTLQEKSEQERQHSERVSGYCLKIGKALGLSHEKMLELETSGIMHDIGKIGIEENILNKEGRLSEEEWRIMKRHSEIGYRILSAANEFSQISNYVLHHHERWDGQGYPRNLKGEEIPLISRIITVADSYDAMISKRCYKESLTKKEAVEELIKNAGKQFDPDIAKVFVVKVLRMPWK